MHHLLLVGMSLVRLSSLAGLLPLSAFWEGPYFAAAVPKKPPLTRHQGLTPNLHHLLGKTTCDGGKRRQCFWDKQKMNLNIITDYEITDFCLVI